MLHVTLNVFKVNRSHHVMKRHPGAFTANFEQTQYDT